MTRQCAVCGHAPFAICHCIVCNAWLCWAHWRSHRCPSALKETQLLVKSHEFRKTLKP
jgi:hypothetical protein